MAEKRYYYLKLEEDYFSNKVQKALRKLPSGAEMCLCYLKMQLLGLRTSGILTYDGIYESFEQEISEEINENENIVKLTIGMLRKWNLIADDDYNKIYMSEMQHRFGTVTDAAKRVAKHREKTKMLQCNDAVTKGNVIKEKELEIEKELEKEKELEREETDAAPSPPSLFETFESEFARPISSIEVGLINQWGNEYDTEIIKLALTEAVKNGARNFRYIEVVLNSWKMAGVRNADEAKKQIETRNSKKQAGQQFAEKKELPKWYYDQDSVKADSAPVDEAELERLMKQMEEG